MLNEDVVSKTDHLRIKTDSLVCHRQSFIVLLMQLFKNSFAKNYIFIYSNLTNALVLIKMNNKKYHCDGTVLKFNRKFVHTRGKIDASYTHIHGRSFFWLGTGTTIKTGEIKLDLLVQASSIS